MLVRILQFLIGALLAGGGGYLAWTQRTANLNVFPPDTGGMPWLVIAGVFGLCAGVVFLVSAVHPRPKTRAREAARAKRRKETLGAAESYYSQRQTQRDRAADSDWRSGDIPPPVEPVAPPAPEPVRMVEPVRVAVPVAEKPAAEKPTAEKIEKPVAEKQVVTAPVAPVAVASAPAPAAKPVATSAPPEPVFPPLFPSTATLKPIPKASEAPPTLVLEKPVAPPVVEAKADARVEVKDVAEVEDQPEAQLEAQPEEKPEAKLEAKAQEKHGAVNGEAVKPAASFGAIRTALAAGKIDDAEKLLNTARETAQGLQLAELTGLAGDHAAAAGRISNAKWLWRLALKRFGELGAMDTPAAQAVSERLRVTG